jgi:ankyrin repeat protein
MVKLLLQNAPSIEDCALMYDLNWAVREQRTTAIAALLDLGARPDRKTRGITLLHLAAKKGWLATLRALHVAVLNGHKPVVEVLLDAGADIEARKARLTPHHLAISEQMINIVQPLLDRGASPAAEADNGINTFHLAVRENGTATVINLLNRYAALVNTKTRYGRPALHNALMSTGYGMARLLVDKGIDVNARTPMENTAWNLSRRRDARDNTFEKLLYSKMTPKPSKIMATSNHSSSSWIDYCNEGARAFLLFSFGSQCSSVRPPTI